MPSTLQFLKILASSYEIYVFTKYGDDYSGEGKAAATVYFELSHCKAAPLIFSTHLTVKSPYL